MFTSKRMKPYKHGELVVGGMGVVTDLDFVAVLSVDTHCLGEVEITMAVSATGFRDKGCNSGLCGNLSRLGSGECGLLFLC